MRNIIKVNYFKFCKFNWIKQSEETEDFSNLNIHLKVKK